MKRVFASAHPATVAIGSLIALFAIAGAAQAVTSTIFKYSTPRTGFLSINATAMSPSNYLDANAYDNQWQSGALFPIGTQQRCFVTGVNLPNGAIVTGLVIYIFGGGADSDVQAFFLRHRFNDGTINAIATKSVFNSPESRIAISVPVQAANATINNATHAYGLNICLKNTSFFSARIKYTYDDAGD